MIEYVTIGEITIDDIITETGEIKRAQAGGGSIYSALGIRLWGHRVGINSVVGKDYPNNYLIKLKENQISTEGIHRIEGWSLRLWLLHEENNKKQQLPKLQSSSFAELDLARQNPPDTYLGAKGFHIAPSTPEGQMQTRDFIRQKRPDVLVSLDILTEPFINFKLYRNGSAFDGIDIFSPSIVEIEALWPGESLPNVIRRIADFGVRWIAIKMDTRGSIVHDAEMKKTFQIPIYPANTVDVTGAGDAYSGGFLLGLGETSDVLQAGMYGTISASFAVEDWGAFHMLDVEPFEAKKRFLWLGQNGVIKEMAW
jgi:sugar/nucleoside kinase (ribokinase family)